MLGLSLPLLRSIDPRRSLAIRLALVVGLSSVMVSLFAGGLIGIIQRNEVTRQIGTLHQQFAQQFGEALDSDIASRMQDIRIIASLMAADSKSASQQALIEKTFAEYSGYTWIGLATSSGQLVNATGDVRSLAAAAGTQLFQPHQSGSWVGDSPCANGDRNAGAGVGGDTSCGLIDLSATSANQTGSSTGVLGAQLGLPWAREIERQIFSPLKETRLVEAFVMNSNGAILLSDAPYVRGTIVLTGITDSGNAFGYSIVRWPDGIDYLTGYALSDGFGSFKGLGWRVVVRESAAVALAPVADLARRTALITVGLGLLAALMSALLINRFVRPLSHIAEAADRIRLTHDTSLPVMRGDDEVARVSRSLNSLVYALDDRNHALESANDTLEDRVRERTLQIELLSDENKQAAVARERLRMARDLHDTLAHTLAALLTQIRLMHKLAGLQNTMMLTAELEKAEEATRTGLMEARAAITQLRSNPVREFGLESALRQLASNFGQRTGIRMTVESSGSLPLLQTDRAETMFRIAEEAFHNIERHANARSVVVELSETPQNGASCVVLRVEDDGCGFDPSVTPDGQAPHYGLRGMQEQAALIQMVLEIHSAPGRGTAIKLTGIW